MKEYKNDVYTNVSFGYNFYDMLNICQYKNLWFEQGGDGQLKSKQEKSMVSQSKR